jgi:hypothetical protein
MYHDLSRLHISIGINNISHYFFLVSTFNLLKFLFQIKSSILHMNFIQSLIKLETA